MTLPPEASVTKPQKRRTMQDIKREFLAQLRSTLERLAKPADFDDLIARGILRRVGRRSYLLLKPKELPQHVADRITTLEATEAGLKVTIPPARSSRSEGRPRTLR